MSDEAQLANWPKFCHHCGVPLPLGHPRFCIECGGDVTPHDMVLPALVPVPSPPHSKGQPAPTVRLGNAGVEQSVIGGTVRLPTSGAIPPGLWVLDEPPGPDVVLALYAPLRAVTGGWSGLIGKGWRADGRQDHPDGRAIFRFSATVEWFPAAGCGSGLRLRARIGAESRGREGRERRGFRYLAHDDAPMTLQESVWVGSDGTVRPAIPIPQIQIMAPPRIPRVSDYDDQVPSMSESEAELWAKGGQTTGLYYVNATIPLSQEHTPVGRGITLTPVGMIESRLHGVIPSGIINFGAGERYRVRLLRPYICDLAVWTRHITQIRAEAHNLGMAMESEPAAEWWLDRNGYDGVIFTKAQSRYRTERVVIAFRRSQIVHVIRK